MGLSAICPLLLNRRFFKYQYLSIKISGTSIVVLACSVFIGAASHIFWDSFTHPQGYFVQYFPALATTMNLGGHPVFIYKILQHCSTLIGFAAIADSIIIMPQKDHPRTGSIAKYWLIIGLTTALTIIARLLTGLKLHQFGNLLVTAIAGGLIGLMVASLILIKNKRVNTKVTFLLIL